jgi:HAD superfamily hydrolase (TIGR01509 family)
MIKCVLVDNDGVLVNTEQLYFLATKEILQACGVELSLQCYIDNCMRASRGVWHLLSERGCPEGEISCAKNARDALYLEYITTRDISLPGAREFLVSLRKSCRICVVTSSKRIHFDRIHQVTGFSPLFDHTLTIEDYAECKPSPVPYLTGLALLGTDGSDAAAIEDSERGLRAAHAAGLRCIVVPNELTMNQDFRNAWQVLPDLQAASAFLAPLVARTALPGVP